ncbi:MAG: adenine phosphoribosyltransferase [candidate division Zixibacteria bacterium]
MDLKNAIRSIPDFPKPGIIFRDITTLLSNPEAFKQSLDEFEKYLRDKNINRIAAIDSRGFLFGGALADRMNIPLSIIRKKGKLPFDTVSASYELEYGTDTLEMHKDAVNPGDRVAVIDDLLATGGTLESSCRMVEELGGEVTVIGIVIELSFLNGRSKLSQYDICALVDYASE